MRRLALVGAVPAGWTSAIRATGVAVLQVAAPWELEALPYDVVLLAIPRQVAAAWLRTPAARDRPAPCLVVGRARHPGDAGPGQGWIAPDATGAQVVDAVTMRLDRGIGSPVTVALGSVTVDLDALEVRDGTAVRPLSDTDAALLRALVCGDGEPVDRAALAVALGQSPDTTSRAVDSGITRLRRRLGEAASHLTTHRGIGYALVDGVVTEHLTMHRPGLSAPRWRLHGRTRATAWLTTELARGGTIGLHGPSGIGKTHLAHTVLAASGRSVVRLEGRTPDTWARGVAEAGSAIVWFDHVEDALEELAMLLAPTHPGSRPGCIVVTARDRLGIGARTLVLQGLAREASLALLHERSADARDEPKEALVALHRLTDGSPGQLVTCAERLAVLAADEVVKRLEQRR